MNFNFVIKIIQSVHINGIDKCVNTRLLSYPPSLFRVNSKSDTTLYCAKHAIQVALFCELLLKTQENKHFCPLYPPKNTQYNLTGGKRQVILRCSFLAKIALNRLSPGFCYGLLLCSFSSKGCNAST